MQIEALVERWREEAANLRRRGQEALAVNAESYADELEDHINQCRFEKLTLKQAAVESGYSRDSITRMASEGKLENVGVKGNPLYRRCDLPKKPTNGGRRSLAEEVIAARE